MRVIAGKYKRLQLNTIKGEKTRPTTDRIKETLFNIIGDRVYNKNFLDLFAGSGQIGIEALSRGAKYVTFIDNNNDCIKCINDNIKKCNITDNYQIIKGNCISELKRQSMCYDIVFLDPPYNKELEKDILKHLVNSNNINKDSLIILEADKNLDISYINSYGLDIIQDKKYKTNRHLFLRKSI